MQTLEQLRLKAKNIRLIVSDMDGTMLDDEKNISEANLEAVAELCRAGYCFSLATGRMCNTLVRYAKQLGLNGYVIGTNGAELMKFPEMTVIKRMTIGTDVAKSVIDLCEKEKMDYCSECVGEYWLKEDSGLLPIFLKSKQRASITGDRVYEVYTYSEYSNEMLEGKEILKLFIKSPDDAKRSRLLKFAETVDGITATSSAENVVEIIASGSQKGSALKELANQLGLDRSEICAIGDYDNDVEMLEFAGLSIAMENAVDKAKAVSDYITKSNNESGVAAALRELFLQ